MKKDKHTPVIMILLIIASAMTLLPYVWMVLTSLKTYEETILIPPRIFPEKFQWVNYQIIWNKFPFAILYLNTFFVVIATVAEISWSPPWPLTRSPASSSSAGIFLFIAILGLLMIPGQIFLVPHYQIINSWGLSNTRIALVLPGIFRVFGVFFLRQAFLTIPREMDEAALVDGANHLQIFVKVLIPLISSSIVSLGILIALWTWTELMWPLIINRSLDKLTLSAGLAFLIGEHTTYYEQVMAGGVISSLPVIILFFFFQRYIIEGIAATGVKG